MKPFDLKKALEGAKVVTRSGRTVTRVAHFPEAEENSRVVALVDGSYDYVSENGMYLESERESMHDLFMAPEKIIFYTFFYGNGLGGMNSQAFTSMEQANIQLQVTKRNIHIKMISEIMPIEVTLNPNL